MDFTFDFIQLFLILLVYVSPILLTLAGVVFFLGRGIGRREGWSSIDSTYYAFITATTVGYGDFHPRHRVSKMLAIVITFVGLILTGIVVALAVNAAEHAFSKSTAFKELKAEVKAMEAEDAAVPVKTATLSADTPSGKPSTEADVISQ